MDNFDEYFDYDKSVDTPTRKPFPSKSIKQKAKTYLSDEKIINIPRNRKGLKWQLAGLVNNRLIRLAVPSAAILLVLVIIISSVAASCQSASIEANATVPATEPPTTKPVVYKLDHVPVVAQDELHAACETYACVMLLKSYNFDIDEFKFVDNYLITRPVYYGDDGNLYGPDMDAAYAGDIYTGFGINAPAMARCMNDYISTTSSKLRAYPLKDVPLSRLCDDYIKNGTPVMVWATTYMQEPYVKSTWNIDYVDEQTSVKQIGDSESWQQNEHCMVLVGFDDKNYYFCDSVAGKVATYDKKTTEDRYAKIGSQAIILK